MVRILLKFPEEVASQPITAQVILEQGVPINILSARISQRGGEMLIDVPPEYAKMMVEKFREKGAIVVTREPIYVDEEKCFSCGACISLCPMNAIKFKEDFSIFFDKEKCIGATCGLCVDACPARAIKLARGET